MTDRITFHLAFPAKDLWQNKAAHKFALARARKASRQEGWATSLEAGIAALRGHSRYTVLIEGYRPTRRGRPHDVHNLPAALKGHIDGIADALQVDDSRLEVDFPRVWAGTCDGGRVTVHVMPRIAVEIEMRGQVV
jgi:hypothetical protein